MNKEQLIKRLENEKDEKDKALLYMEITAYMAKNTLGWKSPNFLIDCKSRFFVSDARTYVLS